MTKPHTPAQNSRKPALSQAAEKRKLRSEAERGAAGGLPTSVLLMGLAGGAVAASGRLPHEKAGSATQDATAQALQDPVLLGAVEAADASLQQASDAAQASVVDGQALQQIVADLVTEAASVTMPEAAQAEVPGATEDAVLTEGAAAEAAAEAAAAESAAAQAAQVAVQAGEAAMAAAGAEGAASQPVLLAQAQVPAASAAAASSSAATAAGTAAAAGAAISTAALVAVGAVVVGAAVASSGGNGPSTTEEKLSDKTAPTAKIEISDTNLKAGETATVTITFSEAVTAFDSAQDVTVQSGTLSAMTSTDGGKTWTGTFTPTADLEDASNVIGLANSYTDVAGNAGTGAQSGNFAVDTKAPTATVALSDSALKAGETATVTITFSEAVTGFDSAQDVTVQSGTLSAMTSTDGGKTWTGTFTPTADLEDASNVISLAASYTDAAGNAGTAAQSANFAVDTDAPAVVSMVADSASGTVTLTFDSPLDGTNLPLVGAFAVTVAGTPNAVASLAIAGNAITLTLTNSFVAGSQVNVTYTDPAGDAANAAQDVSGNDAAGFTMGQVADGYVRGATVYIDTNENGEADPGVDYLVGQTDSLGNFFIPSGAPTGTIIAVGGVNIDTGVPNTVPLKAPAGSTTVNPLTTLVQAVVESSEGTVDAAAAAQTVAQTLGLTLPEGRSLTNFDPIAAANSSTNPTERAAAVEAQKAAAQIATVVALASQDADANADAGTTVFSNLAKQIESASTASSTVNLADASTLGSALANTGVSDAAQSNIADASAAISLVDAGAVGGLAAVSAAQSQFLDTIAPAAPTAAPDLQVASDTGSSSSDNVTSQPSLALRVSFDTGLTNGMAAVAGDKLLVLEGGILVAEKLLSAADIAAGYADVPVSGVSEGSHTFNAQLVDQAGLSSGPSAGLTVTVDRTAPGAPAVTVVAGDDVISSTDSGALVISGAVEPGVSVSLTLGGTARAAAVSGGNWSYTVTAADIAAMGQGAETLSVTATDAAGNASAAGERTIFIDTTPPQATAVVSAAQDDVQPDAGNVSSGGTSNDNTLELSGTVTGTLEQGDRVVVYDGEVALGAATVVDSAWTFATTGLTNSVHAFTARVEDAYGNRGAAGTPYTVTVNASVPTTTAAITGVSSDAGAVTGGITNDTTPTVSGTVSAPLDGEQVVIYRNGARLGVAETTSTTWSYAVGATPGTADDLGAVLHRFTAVVEKTVGGNQGVPSAVSSLNVDLTPPPAPVFSVVAGNGQINAEEAAAGVVLRGTVETGASVSVAVGGQARDAVVTGGSWSYALTPDDFTNMGSGAETLTVTARDAAGNVGTATMREITVDTAGPVAPTVSAIAGDNKINAAERNAPSGVTLGGIVEAGAQVAVKLEGTGGARTVVANVDGTTWSYKLTGADYTLLGQGDNKTVSVVARDAAGNESGAGTRTFAIDTVAPTLTPLTLATDDDSGAKGDSRSSDAQPQFLFSAPGSTPTGTFQLIDAQGNAVGNPVAMTFGSGGGQPATALTVEGTYRVQVVASDDAGNTTTRTGLYTLDSSAPTVLSITDDEVAAKANIAGGPVVFKITFSEGVTGFTAGDITVTGGTKGAFNAINAREYTLAVQPAAGSTSDITVNVPGGVGVAEDIAGNANVAVAAPATQGVDFAAPTAQSIVVTPAALRGGQTGTVTVTFSEPVAGFTNADLSAPSGTLGTMSTSDNGLTWTGSFTPSADTEDATNSVSLTAGSYTDLALNPGAAASSGNYVVDTRAPAFTSGTTAAVDENIATTAPVYTAAATDATGPVKYSLAADSSTDNVLFNIDPTTGVVTFKAPPNFEQPADAGANNVYNIVVTATDDTPDSGQSSTRAVAITVGNVNEAPTAPQTINPPVIATKANYSFNLASVFTDPDAGNTLTFALAAQTPLPAGLTLSNGLISGSVNTAGTTSVTVTATDQGGLPVTRTFSFLAVDAPAFLSLTSNVAQVTGGTPFVLTATLTEPVTVSSGTPTLTLNVGGQSVTAAYTGPTGAPTSTLTFAATAPATGDSISITVSGFDAGGATITGQDSGRELTSPTGFAAANFVVDNTAPSFQGGSAVTTSFAEGTAGAVHGAQASDATTVSYSLDGADASKFAVGAGGVLTFRNTPDFEQPGSAADSNTYVVEVTATDSVGLSSKQTVTVNVGNVNDNQVVLADANSGTNTVAEDASVGALVGVTAAATDADSGATITGYALDNNAGGRFAINSSTGAVTVAGALNHEAATSHTITIRATSSDGSSATQDVTIAVTNVNEAPTVGTINPPPASLNVPYQFNAGVRFTEVDAGDALTFSAIGLPTGLQINSTTGVISGTASVEANAAVSVTATDKGGLTTTAQFTLSVQQGISFTFENDTFIVPTAPVGDETFRVEWATETGENSALFRLETVSDTIDYELWVAVQGSQVVAFKAFSTDAGFLQRSVGSPDGSIYFQVVNATLQRDGSTLTGITQSASAPATTLYAVNPANVVAVLTSASEANTLVGLSGVTKVRDFTRAELGITNEQSQGSMIALLDGYIDDGYWSVPGATSAYASVVEVPFTNTPELSFLGRLDAQGNVLGSTPTALNAAMTDAFPVASVGLFIRTGATATSVEAAYHVNPATGVLSQISTSLFDGIASGGGIPQDATFLSGTDSNDTLGNASAASALRQWIAGGSGNDVLSGGAGNDLLYGGPGSDTLLGSDGNDVLSGMGGDDRLRGGAGADTVYGSSGADRIQLFGLTDLTSGDVMTGSGTIWNGDAATLTAGADPTTEDRIQLLDGGIYNFAAASISFVDRVDVITGFTGATSTTFTLNLSSQMAASADQNRDGSFGDIRVLGYIDSGPSVPNPAATAVGIRVNAEALTSGQSVWVLGQDGSGVTDPTQAFGGLRGNDTLQGGAGSDYLHGGEGDDRLLGRGGSDTLFGGAGTDRVQYYTPNELIGDVVTGNSTTWDGNPSSIATGADNTTIDRIQLLGAGTYNFGLASSISYIDRIDVVSGVQGAVQGDFTLILTPQMASTANQNGNDSFGDIRVVGYHDDGTQTPPPSTANVTVDASAFTTQALIVLGQDGSGITDSTAFGGMAGNDTLIGGAATDVLNSGKGNDVITGGGGNDTIDGSDGQDLAHFSGLFSRYSVSVSNGVVTVTDSASAGGDGVDTLSNVERFEFSDGLYKVNAGGTGLVADVTSLDDLNPAGTAQSPQFFDASSGAFNLTDDATRANYTVIEGYGADDTLRFLGLTSAEALAIGNDGSDVSLTFNNDGVTSTVILAGVVSDPVNTFVYDVASFNALPVGDLLNIFQI